MIEDCNEPTELGLRQLQLKHLGCTWTYTCYGGEHLINLDYQGESIQCRGENALEVWRRLCNEVDGIRFTNELIEKAKAYAS